MIAAVVNDAGRTRENQLGDAMLATSVDHVLRAERVDSVKQLQRPPNSGQGRSVKDDINSGNCCRNSRGVLNVAGPRFDAQCFDLRISPSAEDSYLIAARDELL